MPAETWDYSDADLWAETFPKCNGTSQSPVHNKRKIKFNSAILLL